MRFQWTDRLKDGCAKYNREMDVINELVLHSTASSTDHQFCAGDAKKKTDKPNPTDLVDKNGANTDLGGAPTFDQFHKCYSASQENFFLITLAMQSPSFRCDEYFHTMKERLDTTFDTMKERGDTSFDTMMEERQQFSVLWFTENVFMSSKRFWVSGYKVLDYQIGLTLYDSDKTVTFYVYSFSAIGGSQPRQPPSLMPISFLASMTSTLQEDFFTTIHFTWHRNDFPSPLLKFLSLIPTRKGSRVEGALDCKALTRLEIGNQLALQDIRTVLRHCGERDLPLRLDLNLQLTADVNEELRESPHLRHIHIPTSLPFLGSSEFKDDAAFTGNHHIESMSVDFVGSWYRYIGQHSWTGVTRNRGLKHLYIKFACEDTFLRHYGELYQWAFSDASRVQEMVFIFLANRTPNRLDNVSTILDRLCSSHRGPTNLCHLSLVSTSQDIKQNWPVPEFEEAMVNTDSWDKFVSPRLTMNYYNSRLGPGFSTERRQALVPWKVRAVSSGIVYRRTTFHVPHDMSTANASLLLALLKADISL
jgi:hypothetical protein